jgi:hypothetical protein
MATATSQPKSSGEMLEPWAMSPMTLPTPASTIICLKPPPAATISMIPARGGSPDANESLVRWIPHPAPRPKVTMLTSTAASSATAGVPMKSRKLSSLLLSSRVRSPIARASISTSGSRMASSAPATVGWRLGGSGWSDSLAL